MSKIRLFGHSLLWVLTTGLVVLAILLVVLRFFLTQVPEYKQQLETYLSHEIGGQVVIGEVSARIDGFSPQISLKNVSLDELEQQTNTLSIGEIRLSLSPWDVIQGNIKPSNIIIVNTHIAIKRLKDGRISILGFSSEKDDDSSGDFSWLLEDGFFEVVDSQIVWQDAMRDEDDITLRHANITFQNINNEHRLKIAATLPNTFGNSFVLSLAVSGDVFSSNNWFAKGYLQAQDINLAEVLLRLDIEQFKLEQGVGDIELWSEWKSAELTQVKGRFFGKDVHLLRDKSSLIIDEVNSDFAWNKLAYGWRLDANKLAFETNETRQNNGHFSLHIEQTDDNNELINVVVNAIDIDAVSDILQHADVLEEDHRTLLHDLEPKGTLLNSYLSIKTSADDYDWAACVRLDSFSNNAVEQVPAVDNFNGSGCSTDISGWVDIQTKQGSVYFKGLFRDPLPFDSMKGRVVWSKYADDWHLESKEIQVKSPHISTTTRFNASIFADGSPAFVDLQTNFGEGEAINTHAYLPVGIMGDEVVSWLDNAFKAGKTTGGGAVWRGTLADFPYRNNTGLFQVLFKTADVNLHYADNWPDILGATAEVEFKNQGMHITSSKGRIAGNDIQQAVVGVDDLENGKYLNISGAITEDINGLYEFFKQSPIKKNMGGLLEHSRVSGLAHVELDVKIPLRKGLKTTVNAHASLVGNTLIFPDLDLSVGNVNGDVFYGQHGLSAKLLKASVLGKDVTVDISSSKTQTVITAKGGLDTRSLSKKYPSNTWKNITGKSAATLTVSVPHSSLSADGLTRITLTSDLKGVSIKYPDPIGLGAKEALSLKVSTTLGEGSLPVNISYGERAQAALLFDTEKGKKLTLSKADIHMGSSPASLPTLAGIRLSGHMQELKVVDWQQALNLSKLEQSKASSVNQIDVRIDEIIWPESSFENVGLKGLRKGSAWQGVINSQYMDGEFYLPDNVASGGLIKLDLDRVSLPKAKQDGAAEVKPLALEPTDFPNLDVDSKRFMVGESNLGNLSIKLRRKTNGLIIQQLDVVSSRDKLTAKGAWEKTNGKSVTGLTGSLNSESLGALLKDAGLLSDLEGASSNIYFDLNWPGAPQTFSKATVNGFATVRTKKGRLLNVEPGLGRVFGLLGLDTLKRRLQLDFSDLVQKGLSFDKIKGRFIVVKGDARTDNLYVESPSSRLDIVGRVGLGKEDYNQLITVTPKSTDSLPVAGAIAGGPLLGAAIYIVQKVAGKTVNKLTGYQYHVTGSWDDPTMKQLSQPGGKVFGLMGDILSPVFGVLGEGSSKKDELLTPVE